MFINYRIRIIFVNVMRLKQKFGNQIALLFEVLTLLTLNFLKSLICLIFYCVVDLLLAAASDGRFSALILPFCIGFLFLDILLRNMVSRLSLLWSRCRAVVIVLLDLRAIVFYLRLLSVIQELAEEFHSSSFKIKLLNASKLCFRNRQHIIGRLLSHGWSSIVSLAATWSNFILIRIFSNNNLTHLFYHWCLAPVITLVSEWVSESVFEVWGRGRRAACCIIFILVGSFIDFKDVRAPRPPCLVASKLIIFLLILIISLISCRLFSLGFWKRSRSRILWNLVRLLRTHWFVWHIWSIDAVLINIFFDKGHVMLGHVAELKIKVLQMIGLSTLLLICLNILPINTLVCILEQFNETFLELEAEICIHP